MILKIHIEAECTKNMLDLGKKDVVLERISL
jgi:hypothetical protein